MKIYHRFLSIILAFGIMLSFLPVDAFAAAVGADGKPTDVSGAVYLAIYTAGKEGEDPFPGEPASYPAANYKCLGSDFQLVSASTPFSQDGTAGYNAAPSAAPAEAPGWSGYSAFFEENPQAPCRASCIKFLNLYFIIKRKKKEEEKRTSAEKSAFLSVWL